MEKLGAMVEKLGQWWRDNWLLLAEALKDRDELSLEVVRWQEVMVGVLLRKQAGLCLQLKIGADGETEFKNELLPCP